MEINEIDSPKQKPAPADKKLNIIQLLRFYSTKWRYILVSVVIFLLLGSLYAYMKSPIYEVQANVLITDNDTQSDFLRSFSMADMFGGKSSVDDEIAIMYSYSLFNDIVREFQLNETYTVRKNFFKRIRKYDNTPVEVITPKEFGDTVHRPIQFKLRVNDKGLVSIKAEVKAFTTIAEVKDKTFPVRFKTPYGEFVFAKTDFYEAGEPLRMNIVVTGYDRATEQLQRDIQCAIPNKKAQVITISLNSTNVAFAKKIVNAVVNGYNARGIEENKIRNQITADFIEDRLVNLSSELNTSELELEEYKNNNNLVDLLADAQYIFTKKGTIDVELVKAETETEILEMTRALMNDPNNRYNLIPTPVGAEAAVEGIAEYNKLVLERMNLMNNAKANNVALRTLTAQIDAMRENINNTLDRSLATAEVKLKDLREQMKESDSRLGELPRQEREFLSIKRQQAVKENLYLFLLKQREETNLRMANAIPKGMIIDQAYALSKQVNMDTKQILLLFFILGLLAVPAWYYLKDLFSTTFGSAKELSALTELPIIGEICKDKSGNKIVATDSTSQTGEMFRLLRANIRFTLPSENEKVLVITSTRPGAGKTFISINLALSLAQTGKKVLLIGMDIRHPQLLEYLGMPDSEGLSEYLISTKESGKDLIKKCNAFPELDIIPGGAIPPNPSELLSSQRVDRLIEEMRPYYDYIIIDSAPIGQVSDSVSLSRFADATLFVCRVHYTTLLEIQELKKIASSSAFRRVGLIVNGVKSSKGIYPLKV